MYQFMTSGSESRRSVSAVGAQSTTTMSNAPLSTCVLTSMRLKISSSPGITVSSSAWIASVPAQFISWMKYSWISRQFPSRRSCASICCPHRRSAISVGNEPISASNESPSEWAGSVLITSVRRPARAARTAVAAATVVLPTPPLPVNRITRTASAYGGWPPPGRARDP